MPTDSNTPGHKEPWQIDKRINLSLIGTIVGTFLLGAVGYGELTSRVASVEIGLAQQASQIQAIKDATSMRDSRLARIEAILERIEDRLDRNEERNKR